MQVIELDLRAAALKNPKHDNPLRLLRRVAVVSNETNSVASGKAPDREQAPSLEPFSQICERIGSSGEADTGFEPDRDAQIGARGLPYYKKDSPRAKNSFAFSLDKLELLLAPEVAIGIPFNPPKHP